MERRLFRSKRNRMLLGVCGGIAEYFNIDPVIIRIIAILLLIASGIFPAVIAYFILALIIPLEGSTSTTPRDNIQENIADLRDAGAGIAEGIRTTFQKPEAKTGEPGQPAPSAAPSSSRAGTNRALWVVGLILIIIGLFSLLWITLGWLWRYLWPVTLIVVGLLIIVLVIRRR